ncbi:hypothetical protein D3C84_764540 [compost metagenome]
MVISWDIDCANQGLASAAKISVVVSLSFLSVSMMSYSPSLTGPLVELLAFGTKVAFSASVSRSRSCRYEERCSALLPVSSMNLNPSHSHGLWRVVIKSFSPNQPLIGLPCASPSNSSRCHQRVVLEVAGLEPAAGVVTDCLIFFEAGKASNTPIGMIRSYPITKPRS